MSIIRIHRRIRLIPLLAILRRLLLPLLPLHPSQDRLTTLPVILPRVLLNLNLLNHPIRTLILLLHRPAFLRHHSLDRNLRRLQLAWPNNHIRTLPMCRLKYHAISL